MYFVAIHVCEAEVPSKHSQTLGLEMICKHFLRVKRCEHVQILFNFLYKLPLTNIGTDLLRLMFVL